MFAVASIATSLYLVDLTGKGAPPVPSTVASWANVAGTNPEITRAVEADGTDTLTFKYSTLVEDFYFAILQSDPSFGVPKLTIAEPACWGVVQENNVPGAVYIKATSPTNYCSPTDRVSVLVEDAVWSTGTARMYFRTPSYLITASTDSAYLWTDSEIGPIGVVPASTKGTTSAFLRDGKAWEVEAAGGIGTSENLLGADCEADDPASGKTGNWHCDSQTWLAEGTTLEGKEAYTVGIPGAYYDLVDSNWGETRDLILLIAGGAIGLFGAILFRLVEDVFLGGEPRS